MKNIHPQKQSTKIDSTSSYHKAAPIGNSENESLC